MADTTLQHNQAAAERAAADLRARQEEARKLATKGVDERLKAKAKQVQEVHERQDSSQPTPTQRENDLARVGALDIDAKEDDGSEWETDSVRRQLESKIPGNNPYETRDLSAESTASTSKKK